VVFQKKVCHGRSLNTGGGGLPNPTESTMWGMQLVREELGAATRHVRKRDRKLAWKACHLDPGKLEEGTGKWMRGARVAQV
jgi:hypothetical protein